MDVSDQGVRLITLADLLYSAERIDVRREPAIRGNHQGRTHLYRPQHAACQMHIQFRGAPVPRIIRQINQQLGTDTP